MNQEEAAKLIIGELKMVDKEMLNKLFNERPEPEITMEECIEMWNNTVWHDVIMKRISVYEHLL